MVVAPNFRPSSEIVSTRLGDEMVLAHLGTERILVLNRTATRVWELLCAGASWADAEQTMLEEFEVTAPQLAAELDRLLASLRSEQLIEEGLT